LKAASLQTALQLPGKTRNAAMNLAAFFMFSSLKVATASQPWPETVSKHQFL